MNVRTDFNPAEDAAVYVISVVAEITGLHPQTLRQYDRLGLVSPDRTHGGGRRYSARDISRLQIVQALAAEGINLSGIQRILDLREQVLHLEQDAVRLRARLSALGADPEASAELVPLAGSGALVVWRPRRQTRREGR
jgi:MerR family transcriptional regulator/heat shock protein HspR